MIGGMSQGGNPAATSPHVEQQWDRAWTWELGGSLTDIIRPVPFSVFSKPFCFPSSSLKYYKINYNIILVRILKNINLLLHLRFSWMTVQTVPRLPLTIHLSCFLTVPDQSQAQHTSRQVQDDLKFCCCSMSMELMYVQDGESSINTQKNGGISTSL